MTPGQLLAEARKGLSWTKLALAAQLGEHPTTVRRWEAGEGSPPPDAVQPWLDRISQNAGRFPTIAEWREVYEDEHGQEPSDMKRAELRRRLDAMHWPRHILMKRFALKYDAANALLEGRTKLTLEQTAYLRFVSDPVLHEPLPRGWVRNVDVVERIRSRGEKSVAKVRPDSPRSQARRTRQEAAKQRQEVLETRLQQQEERRALAVRMRLEGHTYDQIGEALGITHQVAHTMIKRAMSKQQPAP